MDLSAEELRAFNGSIPGEPILLAVCGVIYDVSASPGFYGPGADYHVLAGRECGRALARNSLEPEDIGVELGELGAWDRDRLRDWTARFNDKYRVVGRLRTG